MMRPSTSNPKVEYVRRQPQTREHSCHWPGCKAQVPPALWGCKAHWMKIPKNLRNRILSTYQPGQEVDGDVSEEYLDAADAVQVWIEEYLEGAAY
jgi:hypothetical protein